MLTAIDSLEVYKRLKNAKLSEKAAREIANVLHDFTENHLATKRDLIDLEYKFGLKMEQMKNQMIIWYIASFLQL